MSKAAVADDTNARYAEQSIGNKADAAVETVGTTASIMAYIKGVLGHIGGAVGLTTFPAAAKAANGISLAEVIRRISDTQLLPVEATGDADVDISEADYTADYVTILTITPAAGESLTDLAIDLDWNKATTGFDTIATAADTLDVVVQSKIDGTNWRTLMTGTQVTANGDGSLLGHESGQRFHVGPVGEDAEVRVAVLIDTERDDCEIPYRVTYRGAAPTITPVAAA